LARSDSPTPDAVSVLVRRTGSKKDQEAFATKIVAKVLPRTPAKKSSNGVLSPRLFFKSSRSAKTSDGFSASFLGVCRSATPVQSTVGLGKVFFVRRRNLLFHRPFRGSITYRSERATRLGYENRSRFRVDLHAQLCLQGEAL